MTITVRRIAAGALAATGVIHLVLAPEYLGEQAYVGVLFIVGGLACAALAARLWRRDDPPAWGSASCCHGRSACPASRRRTGSSPASSASCSRAVCSWPRSPRSPRRR